MVVMSHIHDLPPTPEELAASRRFWNAVLRVVLFVASLLALSAAYW